jgi:hypothetical protein
MLSARCSLCSDKPRPTASPPLGIELKNGQGGAKKPKNKEKYREDAPSQLKGRVEGEDDEDCTSK